MSSTPHFPVAKLPGSTGVRRPSNKERVHAADVGEIGLDIRDPAVPEPADDGDLLVEHRAFAMPGVVEGQGDVVSTDQHGVQVEADPVAGELAAARDNLVATDRAAGDRVLAGQGPGGIVGLPIVWLASVTRRVVDAGRTSAAVARTPNVVVIRYIWASPRLARRLGERTARTTGLATLAAQAALIG